MVPPPAPRRRTLVPLLCPHTSMALLVMMIVGALLINTVDVSAGVLRRDRERHGSSSSSSSSQKTLLGSAFDWEDVKKALKPRDYTT